MSRKPMTMIRADAELKFPDNTTGEISPADLRSWALDLVDTMTPGYGVLAIGNPPLVQNIGVAAEVVTAYDTVILETEPFTVNQANGTVQALVDIVADISVNLSAEFAQGRELILTIYRDNSPPQS